MEYEELERRLHAIEKKFNEIRPDYGIHFGLNGDCTGFELDYFKVDDDGRVTMEIVETYLNSQYAIRERLHVRHPRLTKEETECLKNLLEK